MKKKEESILSLDLHGFKTDEVFDAVEVFLKKAQTKNVNRVRIIHGKGTGKVKEKVLEYLRMAQYTAKPEVLANGAKNDGALIIFL